MSNLKSYAKLELEVLRKSTKGDAVILPFEKEIMALVNAFGNSGQSGSSAPFVATALSQAIKKLLLFEPMTDITGIDEEWSTSPISNDGCRQNKRCSSLFKELNGECYYLNAIVFKGEEKWDTFTGSGIYIDKTLSKTIGSSQKIKEFPFKPETFYLDVEYVPITEDVAKKTNKNYIKSGDGSCRLYVLKNSKQLDAVKKYYNLEIF